MQRLPRCVGIVPPTVLLHVARDFIPKAIACEVLSRSVVVFDFAILVFALLLV